MGTTRPVRPLVPRLVFTVTQRLVGERLRLDWKLRVDFARVDEEGHSTKLEHRVEIFRNLEQPWVGNGDCLESFEMLESVVEGRPCAVAVASDSDGCDAPLLEGVDEGINLGSGHLCGMMWVPVGEEVELCGW